MKEKNKTRGITLIALVITIIVLLILAGVSIAMLTRENGILSQAQTAKENTEKASVIEQVRIDILGEQLKGDGSAISAGTLQTILKDYFTEDSIPADANDISVEDTILTAKEEYGGHEIPLSDIYNGEIEPEKEVISKTEPYVRNYADTDGDGEADGIIYADLAVGNTKGGHWTNDKGYYTIPTKESSLLKDYYVSKTDYSGPFGVGDLLVAEGSGEPRFYIMSLENFNPGTYYCWYAGAYGKMNDYTAATSVYFGKGAENTVTMIAKWNDGGYGTKDSGSYKDLWGQIGKQVNNGWFVPSFAEWSVFAEELGITTINYKSYGLSDWYWSSSQYSASSAYYPSFQAGYIGRGNVNSYCCVRLSATF